MRRFLVLGPLAAAIGLAQSSPVTAHEKLIPTLWVQTSVEWRAAAIQAYRQAHVQLDRALRDKHWSADIEQTGKYRKLPPAVILDIDETVLDNAPGQARQVIAGGDFSPAQWDQWVREAKAEAIPGALDFCRYAASRNVTVFFVTNRDRGHEEATRANLARLGFPLSTREDTVLTRGEVGEGSDKGGRRRKVAAAHRVLLLIGDDLGDFLSNVRGTPEQRAMAAAPYGEYWGTKWILLPNPSYGSWEQALYGDAPAAERMERKQRLLNPALSGPER
ncbi:MAG: HAD family acid phosphatase [Bryobacteraceae bacterium]